MMITSKDPLEIGNKGIWLFLRMVLATRANGSLAPKFVKVEVSKFGQMVLCTRVNGEIVRSMVGGSSSASMAPTTKENGRKEGTMDEVSYNYQEARYTLATLSMEGS